MSIINNLSDKIDWDNHKCKSNNYNPLMWLSAVTLMSEPAKSHKITVMAKIPIAIYENSLFFPIPLNKLTCSVRILNPLNTAMKHNKANLAVIDLISDTNIFATGLNVIIPYNVMNAVVLIAIRFFAPLIKRPEPFLIGLSNIYSSFGGSPPKR